MQDNNKILFVLNKGAGKDGGTDWQEIIKEYFSTREVKIDFFELPDKPSVPDLKAYIEKLDPLKVVAVGGDGTVTLVAGIIGNSSRQLGILPAGSANGMAKEVGIPEDPEEACKVVAEGKIKCCDAILINEKDICIHISDLGLNAQLIKYFDEGKLRGKLGYMKVIIRTLWHRQKMKVIIQTKDVEVRRKAFMVLLANASMYGFGTVVNPNSQLDDGLFEVVVIRKLSLQALLKMMIKPGPFNPRQIEIFPSTAVQMQTMRPVHFQVDGEYKGKISGLKATVLKHYINIILPV
ncbi:MAG: diacylglycerol kinase family protein [Ferruginibacter sp.]